MLCHFVENSFMLISVYISSRIARLQSVYSLIWWRLSWLKRVINLFIFWPVLCSCILIVPLQWLIRFSIMYVIRWCIAPIHIVQAFNPPFAAHFRQAMDILSAYDPIGGGGMGATPWFKSLIHLGPAFPHTRRFRQNMLYISKYNDWNNSNEY